MLQQLADRQEEYRGIIRDLRGRPDRSFVEAVFASEGMSEDQLVAICTILFELSADRSDRVPQESDVLWAQEFLDHLDTLGFKIVPKGWIWVDPQC